MGSNKKHSQSAPRRGRPPSPPGVSRNHRVVTFVNDSEYEHLNALAQRDHETLSMVAYKLLIKELKSGN